MLFRQLYNSWNMANMFTNQNPRAKNVAINMETYVPSSQSESSSTVPPDEFQFIPQASNEGKAGCI